MSRGRIVAYVVMIAIIANHLFADSYGVWDRLLEIGVFSLIAYEVWVGFYRHRKETRRQNKLNKILASLGQFMDTGQDLQKSVSDPRYTEFGVLNLWMMSVNAWSLKANEFLSSHSPRAAAAFLLVRDSSSADSVVFLDSGRSFHLGGTVREHYQKLLSQLDNLRQIMEKPEIYFLSHEK